MVTSMTTRKRILCISRAYGEHAGGMERLSFELISELKKSDSFDVATIVYETRPGISLLSARINSVLFILGILPRALKQSKNVDVVHIGDPVLSLVGWIITHVRNIPVIVTVHGLDVAYGNPLYQLYLTLFFKKFAGYVAISEYASRLLQKLNVRGDISVIPPGVRDHLYDPMRKRNDLEEFLGKDISNTTVLATTGRLVTRKGHAWFIEHVIPKLPKNILYVVAGSGPEKDTLSKLVESLHLENQVMLLGRISTDDQKTLINTSDAFIQPNILIKNDLEGFGIAPLEAALCGRPVFASNLDGIPSAICHGENGILLPSGDTHVWVSALTLFLRNPKAFEPQGMHARAYTLATFDWKHIKEQYEKIFKEIV